MSRGKVSQILCESSTQYTDDRTHLHYAASRGQLLVLHSLIREGQNVNVRTCNGVTALHDASWTGHVYCARNLIKAGAKVNILDVSRQSALLYASAHGHTDCVQLLLDSGGDPNLPNERVPPLHAAAFEGELECMRLLLSSGADIEGKDLQHHTPLISACDQGQMKAVSLLLQTDTPLHIASRQGCVELSRLLIEYGADLEARNKQDKKPSQVFKGEGQQGLDMTRLFRFYEENPRTLASICRLGLRGYLGPDKLNYIPDLPLPELIKRYLRCDDI